MVSTIDCMSEVNFSSKLGLYKSFVYLFRSEVELQSKRTITLQPKVWSLELYGLLHAACFLLPCMLHPFFHFLAFILWNKKVMEYVKWILVKERSLGKTDILFLLFTSRKCFLICSNSRTDCMKPILCPPKTNHSYINSWSRSGNFNY